jgi:hypothetical protein
VSIDHHNQRISVSSTTTCTNSNHNYVHTYELADDPCSLGKLFSIKTSDHVNTRSVEGSRMLMNIKHNHNYSSLHRINSLLEGHNSIVQTPLIHRRHHVDSDPDNLLRLVSNQTLIIWFSRIN